MFFTSTARLFGIALMIGAAGARADQSSYFRINDPLRNSERLGPSVTESPDGQHLIYMKSRQLAHAPFVVRGLYATDRLGGTEYRLTQKPTGTGNGVFFYDVTADSRQVVYTSNATDSTKTELFAVSLETRKILRLSEELRPGASVSRFLLSPNGRKALYYADQTSDGTDELFIVSTDGGTVRRLHQPLSSGQYIDIARFTPDGEHVVFGGDLGTGPHLYAVDLRRQTTTILSGELHRAGSDFTISPDGQRVVFTAARRPRKAFTNLYSVAIDGSRLVRISPEVTELSEATVPYCILAISPDSRYVVYRADHDVTGRLEFFAVPITGGVPLRISEPRSQSFRFNSVAIHAILPDNTVIFSNDREPDFQFHVFAASIETGAIRQLSHNYLGDSFRFEALTPDGQFVLYRASDDAIENASTELYIAPVSGGEARRVNPDLPAGRDVYGALVSADNQWIVYHSDQRLDDVIELYRVPVTGGTPEKINPDVSASVGGGRSSTWYISADSESVYYNAEIDTPGVLELYASALPTEALRPAASGENARTSR